MRKTGLGALAFLLITEATSSPQGTVGSIYRFGNICGERNGFVYGIDSQNPHAQIRSFNFLDFVGRPRISGDTYTVELWLAPGGQADLSSLRPLAGAVARFLPEPNSGMYQGPIQTEIPGSLGGDLYTLQIRSWDNRLGTVNSWAEVLADDTVPRATSRLINDYELAGLDATGVLRGMPVGCTRNALESLGLYVVPEPPQLVLAPAVFGLWLFALRKMLAADAR